MMFLIAAFALPAPEGIRLDCIRVRPGYSACSIDARKLVCASKETRNIPDDDPALALFLPDNDTLEDAKVQLADERINGCDL